MKAKILNVAAREHCIGCYSCMYACSRTLHKNSSCAKAALRIATYAGVEGAFSIRVCSRCADPDCVKACRTGALTAASGGGARLTKKELCSSCGECVKACAIHGLQWDEGAKRPIPCIQCGTCVKYCPNSVLELKEAER